MRKVKYIRPTHLNRMTGEKIELLGVKKGTCMIAYYDHNGEYIEACRDIQLDFLELEDDEKKIQTCKK